MSDGNKKLETELWLAKQTFLRIEMGLTIFENWVMETRNWVMRIGEPNDPRNLVKKKRKKKETQWRRPNPVKKKGKKKETQWRKKKKKPSEDRTSEKEEEGKKKKSVGQKVRLSGSLMCV